MPVATPGRGDHLLLAVSPDTNPTRARVMGIAVVGAGGELRRPRRTPWREHAPNPFAPFGLQPGRAFTLLLRGRPAGTATVDSANAYLAAATVRDAPEPLEVTLATDLPVDSGAAQLLRATPAQRRTMKALLRDTMAAHQVAWIDAHEQRDLLVNPVRLRGGTVVLVGTFLERRETQATDFPFMSVMIIAEPDGSGVYRAVYSRLWGEAGSVEPYTPQVLDVVDLDGDGTPELVTATDVTMGSNMFSVLRRGAQGWREVFRSGC